MLQRIVLFVAVLTFVASPAAAQTSIDAAVAVSEQGYYIAPDASARESDISDLVARARNDGLRLSIVVLDENPPGGATTFAGAVFDAIGGPGTVIVLAEDGFVGYETEGEVERAELEAALDAADSAGGSDVTYLSNIVGSLIGDVPAVTQPGPVPAAESGGGSGGLWILLVIVGGGAFLIWLAMRRSKKAAQARVDGNIASARAEIQAQLNSMANDILDLESSARLGGNQAVEYFEAGATVYQRASEEFERAQTLDQLETLAGTLDEAAWQLDAAQAIVEGEPVPPKPKKETARCFFDPTHRGPMVEATIETSAGSKEVLVCREDAAKLAAGKRPDPRMIDVGGRRVPAPQAPKSHGGGGFGGMDLLSILVGGASQALPDLLGNRRGRRSGGGLFGRSSSRASSRRTGPIPGPSTRRSTTTTSRSSRRSSSSPKRSRGGRRRKR